MKFTSTGYFCISFGLMTAGIGIGCLIKSYIDDHKKKQVDLVCTKFPELKDTITDTVTKFPEIKETDVETITEFPELKGTDVVDALLYFRRNYPHLTVIPIRYDNARILNLCHSRVWLNYDYDDKIVGIPKVG